MTAYKTVIGVSKGFIMDIQQAERLRALWKSGRDKYSSFFAGIEEVRREIGNESLPAWCVTNLQIGLVAITKAVNLLNEIDAQKAKAALSSANKAGQEQKRAYLNAQRKAKEEEKQQREHKKAELKKQVSKKRRQKRRIERKQEIKSKSQEPHLYIKNDLNSLKTQWIEADKLCKNAIEQWVEGSIAKVRILSKMRDALPADQDFGKWVNENIPELNNDDRSALVGLGCYEEITLRNILTNTDSRSYQLIWRTQRQPKVVES